MNDQDLKFLEQYGLDRQILIEIVSTRMPFGKYQGVLICDLPEAFLIWFKGKGWPSGRLGILLENTLEIKSNGANFILKQLQQALSNQKN
ncbi:MAG: DUF3820 family protein [Saprospiraceae bacterium]|nr:DUF3820 family protein [Saprospiraceae bacterium]